MKLCAGEMQADLSRGIKIVGPRLAASSFFFRIGKIFTSRSYFDDDLFVNLMM